MAAVDEHDAVDAGVTGTVPPDAPLWSLPSSLRHKHGNLLLGIAWAVLFNAGIILIHVVQLSIVPLSFFASTKHLHARVLNASKAWFAYLIVLMSQLFAPTTFVVTANDNARASFDDDPNGLLRHIVLPDRAIWMANHQTLCDWLYLWTLAYLTGHDDAIYIALKASIRKVPIIGVACSMFKFMFLARNWTQDKVPFKRQLDRVAQEVVDNDERLCMLIFPEGTIVTGRERPKSAAFAAKMGLQDMKHCLLPRSTGLFFALRTLVKKVPELELVDLTVAYPGTKLPYWPEDYYNLAIWFKQVPPPSLHFHIRTFSVAEDIPLGDLSGLEGTGEEKKAFDGWLRDRWREKDDLLQRFLDTGSFVDKDATKRQHRWDTKLQRWWQYPASFGFFAGVAVLYFVLPLVWWALVRLPWQLASSTLAASRRHTEL